VLQQDQSDVWNVIDVVTALDRTASYYEDRSSHYREALTLLEQLQAEGRLPSDTYLEWMTNYRKALGLE
jgi:hypothetical protein